ncbi:hypothetical protein [Sediminibacterium sp.]|uniref:hypothetical protein n=1 Tax=Sediminibacterium sp. TaxID=1917865 RepID=UPI003F6A13F4
MSSKKSAFYQFLEPYLERGNTHEIEEAKKEYRRQYQRAWEQKKRSACRTFKVSFEPKDMRIIEKNKGRFSITQFIKVSCLSYCTKENISIPPLEINEMRGLITQLYQEIDSANEVGMLSDKNANLFQQKIDAVEKNLLTLIKKITNPEGYK